MFTAQRLRMITSNGPVAADADKPEGTEQADPVAQLIAAAKARMSVVRFQANKRCRLN